MFFYFSVRRMATKAVTISISPFLATIFIITSSSYFDCRYQTCIGTTLTCTDNEDCFIDCAYFTTELANDESCQDAIFNCPANASCTILCDGREACNRATTYARNSLLLNITCNDHYESCHDASIYCPDTTNPTSPTCLIYGDNTYQDGILHTKNSIKTQKTTHPQKTQSYLI